VMGDCIKNVGAHLCALPFTQGRPVFSRRINIIAIIL
jgi:hypothetical protein